MTKRKNLGTKKRNGDIVFTRGEILRALKREPLRRGEFVEKSNLPMVGNCNVCAVGAVLRGCGFRNNEISVLAREVVDYPISSRPHELLKAGDWTSALSSMFEMQPSDRAGQKAVLDFVRKHFPATVTLRGEHIKEIIDVETDDMFDKAMYDYSFKEQVKTVPKYDTRSKREKLAFIEKYAQYLLSRDNS